MQRTIALLAVDDWVALTGDGCRAASPISSLDHHRDTMMTRPGRYQILNQAVRVLLSAVVSTTFRHVPGCFGTFQFRMNDRSRGL